MIIEGKICCLSLGTRLHLKAEVTLLRTNIYECIIILVSLIYMHLGYLQPQNAISQYPRPIFDPKMLQMKRRVSPMPPRGCDHLE